MSSSYIFSDEYKQHMLRSHPSSTGFFHKKSALGGVVRVLSKNLNLGYQPEILLTDKYIKDMKSAIENFRTNTPSPFFKLQAVLAVTYATELNDDVTTLRTGLWVGI